MAEGTLPSLEFKKTISTSTKFLEDIWYTWSNHGNNQSQKADGACRFFNNVKCSNKNKNQEANLDSSVYDNVEIGSDDGISQNQDKERQKRKYVIQKRHSSRICDVPNFSSSPCKLDSSVPMTDPRWTPDNLLTDALLDKMLIYKVQDNKKLSYFYMQSRVLYKYLSYKIGSEYMVKFRWKVWDKMLSAKFYGIPVVMSGSKAEGLDMSGSDIDMMMILTKAHEGRESAKYGVNFLYDSLDYEECPGYVTVDILIKGQTEEIIRLPSSNWKNMLIALLPLFHSTLSFCIHGPSLSGTVLGESFDQVSCLKSQTWPKIADEWIFRKRHFGWPTTEMVSAIVSAGCHIVPISSKVDQSNGKEWRLSFSIAEKKLIRSFNHVQILIYGLLKIVLKEIIQKEESLKDLLCSYFLKTTLFWAIEETNQDLWNSKYTILCYNLCIERLIRYVIEDNCPNYFVPINNMFLGRFSQPKKEHLLHALCTLSDQGLRWTDMSSTMSNLTNYIRNPYFVFEISVLQRRAEKEEIVKIILRFLKTCKTLIFFSTKKLSLLLPLVRSLLKIPLVKNSATHIVGHFIETNDRTMSNKEKYSCEQIVLNMILHRSDMDHVSRDSMLASWLYRAGKFHDCLNVLDTALMSFSRTVFHFGAIGLTVIPETIDDTVNIHQILKLYSTLSVQLPMVSHIIPTELLYFGEIFINSTLISKYISNNSTEWCFYPEQYFYFMKCLCHLKLDENEGFSHCLKQMTDINFKGSEYDKANYMLMQMILKIVLQMTKKGEKEFSSSAFEEMNSSSLSDITSSMEQFIYQGFNPDIDNQTLNALQVLNWLKETGNRPEYNQ